MVFDILREKEILVVKLSKVFVKLTVFTSGDNRAQWKGAVKETKQLGERFYVI